MSASTSVRLPDGLRSRLQREAKARGTTVNRLIVETMDRQFPEPLPESQRADIALAQFIGCVESDGTFDATNATREFSEILERRKAAGHL